MVEVDTCGACDVDADCGSPSLYCVPIFDTTTFAGQKFCLSANSLSQDDFCLPDGNGDIACASNICSLADVGGLAEIGACGECDDDGDCGMGETCVAGAVDTMGDGALTGSTCQVLP